MADTDADELAGIMAATDLDELDARIRRVEWDQLGARRRSRDDAMLAFWIGVTVGLWLALTARAALRTFHPHTAAGAVEEGSTE